MISVLALLSCNEEEIINDIQLLNKEVIASKAPFGAIIVAPSHDQSGVTDANNIENALNLAKATGGIVYLSDGQKNTTDHYYTSRNIVISGFNGSLIGEGKNKTIIHAGRKSVNEGFTPAPSPLWSQILPSQPPVSATVFQFDNSTGDVILSKFSILVEGEAPVSEHIDYYGNQGTHIWTAIELIGGFFNTSIEDVTIIGEESTAYGNENGFNLGWAIHVMPFGGGPFVSWPPPRTQGSLTMKNIDIENIAYDAILFMDYRDGSEVLIDEISAKNVGYGISGSRINDSEVKVSNVDVICNSTPYSSGMFFWFMQSGPSISNSSIKNSNDVSALILWNLNNASVTTTSFQNCNGFLSGIGLFGAMNCAITNNDYKESGFGGWTDTSAGPGAVFMNGFTSSNYIHEMKFPPGLTICDMVTDYGTNNTIHNWQSCETVSEKLLEKRKVSKLPLHYSSTHKSSFSLK